MKQLDKLLQSLGEPYDIQDFDGEDCIHRKFGNYEFEGFRHKSQILYPVCVDSHTKGSGCDI